MKLIKVIVFIENNINIFIFINYREKCCKNKVISKLK